MSKIDNYLRDVRATIWVYTNKWEEKDRTWLGNEESVVVTEAERPSWDAFLEGRLYAKSDDKWFLVEKWEDSIGKELRWTRMYFATGKDDSDIGHWTMVLEASSRDEAQAIVKVQRKNYGKTGMFELELLPCGQVIYNDMEV